MKLRKVSCKNMQTKFFLVCFAFCVSLNPGDKLRTPDDDLKAGDLLSTFKQKNFHLMQSYFCNFRDGNLGMHFYYYLFLK